MASYMREFLSYEFNFKEVKEFINKEKNKFDLYKTLEVGVGFSDIACLIYQFARGGVGEIKFGGDGDYHAYIIDETIEVPSHYEEVARGQKWLNVYDDEGKRLSLDAPYIKIYRAGGYGLLIRIADKADDIYTIEELSDRAEQIMWAEYESSFETTPYGSEKKEEEIREFTDKLYARFENGETIAEILESEPWLK